MPLQSKYPLCLLALLTIGAAAAPVTANSTEAQLLANPDFGPQPGKSSLFSTYYGLPPPFPANVTVPIYPTKDGLPAPDDELWQNLLAAEWIIFSFYQSGVEAFNTSSFTDIGFPNTTYQRIMEIRDNEAGHLRIFQNQISATSVKPGPCEYQFPFDTPTSFLALSTLIEIASMAFLTGLVQEAQEDAAKGALTAIGQVETRHETWVLLEAWGADPFSGPSDTAFPYAKEILDITNEFVVRGSCPSVNPQYPYPSQDLPNMRLADGTTSVTPGSSILLNFTNPTNQPTFKAGTEYYAVFLHGITNISVPIDTSCFPWKAINVTIPRQFETKGVIIAVIADLEGAPTLESIVAGPTFLLEQPVALGTQVI
ncbi:hypothetical protein GQ53DRAFT_850608 [Thozetella sp. PMI_491]|nr:hypothetical protein GQ53DRAFT_850608 [Thozetella sp. PMI_491]